MRSMKHCPLGRQQANCACAHGSGEHVWVMKRNVPAQLASGPTEHTPALVQHPNRAGSGQPPHAMFTALGVPPCAVQAAARRYTQVLSGLQHEIATGWLQDT